MREIDGVEIYGVEDVRIGEEAFCEHCYDLEPFTPVVEKYSTYCLDCAKCINDFIITKEEEKDIEIQSVEKKILYFEERLTALREKWATLVLPKDL